MRSRLTLLLLLTMPAWGGLAHATKRIEQSSRLVRRDGGWRIDPMSFRR